jgi:hypothetical protein
MKTLVYLTQSNHSQQLSDRITSKTKLSKKISCKMMNDAEPRRMGMDQRQEIAL